MNILGLPTAGPLGGSELIYGVQGGVDIKLTPDQIKAYIGASVTASIPDGNKGDVTVSASGATWKLNGFTPFGKSLGSAVDATAARTLLGFSSGAGGYQPYSTNLTSIAELISAANTFPFFTGSGSASLAPITAFGRSILDDNDAAAVRATIGAQEATTITAFAKTLLDDADAAAARATLGIVGSGSGSLTNFSESLNNTVPNASWHSAVLAAIGTAADIDFIISPKGAGAISRQVADAAVSGGNKRGNGAVDFQNFRSAANQVASGQSSFIAGENNRVSGQGAASFGYANDVSGPYSFGTGSNNTISGGNSATVGGSLNSINSSNSVTLGGRYLSSRGIHGIVVFGSNTPSLGKRQGELLNFAANTTDASQTDLGVIFSPATATNQFVLNDNAVELVTGSICAIDIATQDVKTWDFKVTVRRKVGISTTAIVGTPVLNVVAEDTDATSWSVSFQADTGYGGLKIRVTGQAGKNIYWHGIGMGCYLEA